jgi:ABC-type proline/glycine betaine transport system permease subunit
MAAVAMLIGMRGVGVIILEKQGSCEIRMIVQAACQLLNLQAVAF